METNTEYIDIELRDYCDMASKVRSLSKIYDYGEVSKSIDLLTTCSKIPYLGTKLKEDLFKELSKLKAVKDIVGIYYK